MRLPRRCMCSTTVIRTLHNQNREAPVLSWHAAFSLAKLLNTLCLLRLLSETEEENKKMIGGKRGRRISSFCYYRCLC
eukprot:1157587-Pelagomonas_calceolata.AAC.10